MRRKKAEIPQVPTNYEHVAVTVAVQEFQIVKKLEPAEIASG